MSKYLLLISLSIMVLACGEVPVKADPIKCAEYMADVRSVVDNELLEYTLYTVPDYDAKLLKKTKGLILDCNYMPGTINHFIGYVENKGLSTEKRVECGVVSIFGKWYSGGKYDELLEGRVRAVSVVELK